MNLNISHLIFLNKEQRYKLADGESVEVTGVTIPVQIDNKSVEDVKEFFCRYVLTNQPDSPLFEFLHDGFCINFPQDLKEIKTKEDLINALIKRVQEVSAYPDVNALKDIKEGGSEYVRFNACTIFENNMQVMHNVEIKDSNVLLESIC